IAVASQHHRLNQLLERKTESDHYASLLEFVADISAANHPDFALGFPEGMVGYADDPVVLDARALEVQSELADLRLRERAELGRAFDEAIQQLSDKTQGF